MNRKPFLLDINVLLALAWPNHIHHREAEAWFLDHAVNRFRTCPLTQIGFVRISSNPAFTPEAAAPSGALDLLHSITQLPGHQFWVDDIELGACTSSPLTGHRQVVDLYLMKLAAAHGGIFATLDRGAAVLGRREGLSATLVGQRLE
jgi:toxin-antitoxin system PIN domain toxin